jgi:hypothetical protein
MTIVRGLAPRQRREFLKELLGSGLLTEDERDAAVIESRRGGPTRPLKEFVVYACRHRKDAYR